MATLALVINTSFLIWASRTFKFEHGVAQVFAGNCQQAETINTWIHLVINALSTTLLSSSNYCMQILSAPTRKEIDSAHAKQRWLDFGVPSIRNLKAVSNRKVVAWWLLGLSSVPLHLVYNSVFFSTIASNEYEVVFANASFVHGGPQGVYDKTKFPIINDTQIRAKSWDRLEPAACINSYATEFLNTRRNLVVVVFRNEKSRNDSSVQEVVSNTFNFTIQKPDAFDPYRWICDTGDGDHRYDFDKSEMKSDSRCSSKVSKVKTYSNMWHWQEWDIDYCLSEPVEGKCSLNFSLSTIVVVIICNVGKSLLMFFVAFRIKDDPLVTIGDAVDSFLNSNDPTTEGMCLISKKALEADECVHYHQGLIDFNEDASSGKNGHSLLTNTKADPIQYQPSVKRWLNAASGPRWWACALLSVPRYAR
jgi:hypothetical protein